MDDLIKSEVNKIKAAINQSNGITISDDQAFNHLLLKYIFNVDANDRDDMITDNPNDGGIDFVYYDEDESRVILGQAKYRDRLSVDETVSEFIKMNQTVDAFRNSNTGIYNHRLKAVLQNALDRLPDDNSYNVEYNLFTTAPINLSQVLRRIDSSSLSILSDCVKIYTEDDIKKEIESSLVSLDRIGSEKVKLDKAKNYLEYNSDDNRGIMCNIASSSLISLYNKYAGHGLFDLNIRKYIRNKMVDSGINETLDHDRENFWFLNNGITIACDDFEIDGNTVWLEGFSIVNGGQTTYLIGNYKGSQRGEFYIPCKIVAVNMADSDTSFFTKIAEATNSQKPIYPRDLKSNTPEMIRLKRLLADENICMENKRSTKKSQKTWRYTIKNDELAQLILSFAFQQPGTARSGKQKIFGESDIYAKIFKVNYTDVNKRNFLIDLIDLYDRYKVIENKYKSDSSLKADELGILKNGRQVLFALMGVMYRIENSDIMEIDLKNDPRVVKNVSFTFSRFISSYSHDDLNLKLERIIRHFITILADIYRHALAQELTTSVSNFFKRDNQYYDEIVAELPNYLSYLVGQEIMRNIDIFKRG